MVCDYFFPSVGGVETHVQALALSLMELGHAVIVYTRRYGELSGDHTLPCGLRVHYADIPAVFAKCVLPSVVSLLPSFSALVSRERISIVHTHAVCTMAIECMPLAAQLGCAVVHTEHSSFALDGVASRVLNRLQRAAMCQADAVTAVSQASRANLCARCGLIPARVHVIPNAVDTAVFTPRPGRRPSDGTVVIVVMARMTRRKGAHLLAEVVPHVCARCPRARFVIGGGGPHLRRLRSVCDAHGLLGTRVELLGEVAHVHVADVLTRGHIFLNASVTEAFCMGILEAVACGLLPVSTRVGGVPEILPPGMVRFAEPDTQSIVDALADAVGAAGACEVRCHHAEVAAMYSWRSVALRTHAVYAEAAHRARARPRLTLAQLCRRDMIAASATLLQQICLLLLRVWRAAPTWTSSARRSGAPVRGARLLARLGVGGALFSAAVMVSGEKHVDGDGAARA